MLYWRHPAWPNRRCRRWVSTRHRRAFLWRFQKEFGRLHTPIPKPGAASSPGHRLKVAHDYTPRPSHPEQEERTIKNKEKRGCLNFGCVQKESQIEPRAASAKTARTGSDTYASTRPFEKRTRITSSKDISSTAKSLTGSA